VAEAAGTGKKGPFFTSIGRVSILPDSMLIPEEKAGWVINDQEVTIFDASENLKRITDITLA
jgi:hypothetical protein